MGIVRTKLVVSKELQKTDAGKMTAGRELATMVGIEVLKECVITTKRMPDGGSIESVQVMVISKEKFTELFTEAIASFESAKRLVHCRDAFDLFVAKLQYRYDQ